MTSINGFRLVGDLTHFMAIVVLMWKIWETQSCIGISGRTQVLYAFVFIARYMDLVSNFVSVYNTSLKIIYILATLGTIGLMFKTRATYDNKNDTFRAEILIVLALLLALSTAFSYEFLDIMWTFSIYLEAVALLPQFYMINKIGQIESITAFYVFALGAYRALYIFNWIYRFYFEGFYDMNSVIGGSIQTLCFCGFFCGYQFKNSTILRLPTEILIAEKNPGSELAEEKGSEARVALENAPAKNPESPRI